MRLNPVTLPWKSCLFYGILWVAPSKDPAASSLATVRCRVTPKGLSLANHKMEERKKRPPRRGPQPKGGAI